MLTRVPALAYPSTTELMSMHEQGPHPRVQLWELPQIVQGRQDYVPSVCPGS